MKIKPKMLHTLGECSNCGERKAVRSQSDYPVIRICDSCAELHNDLMAVAIREHKAMVIGIRTLHANADNRR